MPGKTKTLAELKSHYLSKDKIEFEIFEHSKINSQVFINGYSFNLNNNTYKAYNNWKIKQLWI